MNIKLSKIVETIGCFDAIRKIDFCQSKINFLKLTLKASFSETGKSIFGMTKLIFSFSATETSIFYMGKLIF